MILTRALKISQWRFKLFNMTKTTTQLVDIDNTRNDEQRGVMEQIIAAGHCPFCLENLRQYHRQPILKETKHWILTPNQWPYDFTQLHLMAILKTHREELYQLTAEMGAELFELLGWAQREYDVPGGGFAMRFGDTNYSAGTVKHIHVQFIVPDINAADFQPVRFKIGKEASRRQQ